MKPKTLENFRGMYDGICTNAEIYHLKAAWLRGFAEAKGFETNHDLFTIAKLLGDAGAFMQYMTEKGP